MQEELVKFNNMIAEALFSSKSDEWTTPQNLFYELNKEFNFKLDAAATAENSKCTYFIDKETNALTRSWKLFNTDKTTVWLNPPYSMCKEFIKKAYEESLEGNTIVALVPSRTDTKWFHEYVYNNPNVEIRFIKGRLKFGDSKNSAPFPSMIVIFKPVK